jgi:2-iminobutanoate/2-iminopropanoate deaminase
VPKRFNPAGVHPPTPTYRHIVEDEGSGLIFIAGQVGLDVNNQVVAADMAGQLRQILANYDAILAELGLSRNAFLKRLVFVTDMDEYLTAAVSQQMTEYFGPNPCASSLIGVTRLLGPEIKIEIEAVLTRRDA